MRRFLILFFGLMGVATTAVGQRSSVKCGEATLHLAAFSNGHVRTDNIHIRWNNEDREVFAFPTTWRVGQMVYYKLNADTDYIVSFDKQSKNYWLDGIQCN